MDSVGRMTRSKARALGATPTAAMPSKAESKTTGRRRKGAAKVQEQQSEESLRKQLQFSEEPPIQEQVPAEQQPVIIENSKYEDVAQPTHCQIASEGTALAGAMHFNDSDVHAESHDNPSVLMASPIILTPQEHPVSINFEPVPLNLGQTTFVSDALEVNQSITDSPLSIAMDDTMLSPLPIEARPFPIDVSPRPPVTSPLEPAASPLPMALSPVPMESTLLTGAIEGSPLDGDVQPHSEQDAAQSPGDSTLEGSPIAALTPHSFRSDAPQNDILVTPQPMAASIPASPLSLTAEAIEAAIFSPMPEDDFLDSPISLSVSAEPIPPSQLQLAHDDEVELEGMEPIDDGDDVMADATPLPPNQDTRPNDISPLSFASDCRAARPGMDPSPLPAFAGAPSERVPPLSSTPPALQSSSFQGFAAVLPTPGGSELEPYSPSLAGLMSANAPSPSMFLVSAGAVSSGAETALSPSSIAISQDPPSVAATVTDSYVDPLQTNAAAPSTTPPTSAPEVNLAVGAECAGASCTLSVSSQHHAGNTMFSPLSGSCLPSAPAPTPESGELSGWTLPETPLAIALAVSVTNAEEGQCEDAGELVEPNSHVDASNPGAEDGQGMEDMSVHSPVQDMEMDDEVPPPGLTTTPCAPIASVQIAPAPPPSVASVAKGPTLQGRSPAVGSLFRNSGATPTPGKTGVKPVTPARLNYVHVESRYNKTPTTGTTSVKSRPSIAATSTANGVTSTTPSASASAAPSTKSVKRVSIHTPEGPRAVAPHRQVVPTPFRPKSAAQSSSPPVAEAPLVEKSSASVVSQPQQQTSSLVEERRAKAAERLKAIHATESGSASGVVVRPSSGPGYLAPTHAFAVKSSAKAQKGSDLRSLRQLKKEVKEAVAKKEAKVVMTEARSTKLTPKVPERPLPMPGDDESSDDQAEYNEGQENELVAAMTGLEVAPPKKSAHVPLRGLPAPQGRHIRFNDTGKASESPQRTVLRGLPVATGKYKRFE